MRYCARCKSGFRTQQERCPNDGGRIAEQDEDPLVGHELGGRYRILARLARGGMGVIYRGEHLEMGKHFAVKVLYGDVASDAGNVERFRLEARSASRLDHPNIISVTDFDRSEEGLLFLVMELLRGEDLYRRVQRRGPYAVPAAVFVMRQMTRALAHAHQQKLVHRDLKCENVFLARRDETEDFVKILDFGLARLRDVALSVEAQHHESGMVFGTPEYMPPEQAQGKDADARSDLYSLGIIAYRLLTGVLPFTGPHAMDICTQQILDAPKPFKDVRPDMEVPPELEAVVRKLLAKRQRDRYQRAEDVLEALDPFPPHSRYGIPELRPGAASVVAVATPATSSHVSTNELEPIEELDLEPDVDVMELPKAPPIPPAALPTFTALDSIALDRLLEQKRTQTRPTAPPTTTDMPPVVPKRSIGRWAGAIGGMLALAILLAFGVPALVAIDDGTGDGASTGSAASGPGSESATGPDAAGVVASAAPGGEDEPGPESAAATTDGPDGGRAAAGGPGDEVADAGAVATIDVSAKGPAGGAAKPSRVGSVAYRRAKKHLKESLKAAGLTHADLTLDAELAALWKSANGSARTHKFATARTTIDRLRTAVERFDYNRKFLAKKLSAVGKRLDKAEKRHGSSKVAPLRNRWHRIAAEMPSGISKPAARKRMCAELTKILRDI